MFNFRSSKRHKRTPLEPQDVLLDVLAKKREKEIGVPDVSPEVPLSRTFLQVLFALTLLFFLYSGALAFHVQIIEGEDFAAQALANRFRSGQGEAERGVIYDRNGEQLVSNTQSFHLIAYPAFLPDNEENLMSVYERIESLSGIAREDLDAMLSGSEQEKVYIARDIDHPIFVVLQSQIEDIPGFDLEASFKRSYVDSSMFSHVIGYTGKISGEEYQQNPEWYTRHDWVGKAGVERTYEHVLRMSPGEIVQERDVQGKVIGQHVQKAPAPGSSITLSIDGDLQRVSYNALSAALESLGASKGVVVAMDPQSGEILSLVSIPSYDNTKFQYGTQEEIVALFSDPQSALLNRAIAGLYPTGSAVKPFIALAALEEDIISSDKQIYAGGKIEIPHRYDPSIVYTFRDLQTYGWTDMRRAIAQSVNVYFYSIGGGYEDQEGLGPLRIKKYLDMFGFGKETGIDLPGEEEGLVPSPEWKLESKGEAWWDGDTYLFSIGQGNFLATPLQVASSFTAIVNGGTLYKPQLVTHIHSSSGQRPRPVSPQVLQEGFFDPEHAIIIREGMRDAVQYGSSVHLQGLPVSSGAKTGTAQTGRQNVFHNWVAAFAPFKDPEIVLVVLIEDVEGLRQAVLPVARNILEWYFTSQ